MDDLQAIRRLKSGDIGGLEILIARYQGKAVRTAYLVTHDEPMAEDVVQETFLRFYQRARYFDEDRGFEPYFLSSVVHAALNSLERESHSTKLPEDNTGTRAFGKLLAQAGSVEDQVERDQLKQTIDRALKALSPRQRAVVVQRYYLDMSEREMTEALDIAPGTVKWLLNAARARLRTLLSSARSLE